MVNAKPGDSICRFRLSVTGLTASSPNCPLPYYALWVYGPNGYNWSQGSWTDANGSFTLTGSTTDQILSATRVEIRDGSNNVVLTGQLQ